MRQTTIHLPAPCAENWAAMTPAAAGRHCAACQTQVVDFTHMTDGEVVAFLRQNANVTCGRFRESQLSRPLLAAAQPVARWRRWAGATLALLGVGSGFGLKAQAQAGPGPLYSGGPVPAGAARQAGSWVAEAPVITSQPVATSTRKAPVPIPDSLFLVRGVVRNWWGVRKAGARVSISGIHDTTDARGHFRVLVPKEQLATMVRIRVSYWNPHGAERRLTAVADFDSARTRPYHVTLKKSHRVLMGAPRFR
ncbi:MAG: hypothetical protein ACRYFX_02350 [Janthinobacterium lividum]